MTYGRLIDAYAENGDMESIDKVKYVDDRKQHSDRLILSLNKTLMLLYLLTCQARTSPGFEKKVVKKNQAWTDSGLVWPSL